MLKKYLTHELWAGVRRDQPDNCYAVLRRTLGRNMNNRCIHSGKKNVESLCRSGEHIRPDHFINQIFLAENIKITEFYNKLKTKFNTDEEIYVRNPILTPLMKITSLIVAAVS
jgi:chromosome condensin MukBEF MukE localization factor